MIILCSVIIFPIKCRLDHDLNRQRLKYCKRYECFRNIFMVYLPPCQGPLLPGGPLFPEPPWGGPPLPLPRAAKNGKNILCRLSFKSVMSVISP